MTRTTSAARPACRCASYFAGPKARWLLDNVQGLRERAEAGDILFGTMDSWVIWNLTGGVNGGHHVTDVTNASRTMLMNLHTLAWDEKIAESIGVPLAMLPEIRSSAEVYGEVTGGPLGELLGGIPVAWRSATSRRPCSARPASPRARPSPRTAPARSC